MCDASHKQGIRISLTVILRAVDENNTLIRENADLRIQLERKDSRIRDLERENEDLRKMRKGSSGFYDQAGRDAG